MITLTHSGEETLPALWEACLHASFDTTPAQLIRALDNAIWRLPEGVVARVHQPGTTLSAQKEIDGAYWLYGNGVPASLTSAATSTEFDRLIKDSHNQAFDEVGLDVGTPVLRIAGTALFGPVLRQAPRGEAAGQLWDGLLHVAATDGFYEIKRSRDSKPSFE
ncbi:hypothetical protein [Streptomyces sp. NPDC004435]|uniref:mycothiol-dependent nitroreductase Rv2466c family protein n=1 Tax=Streptomyces sp. NPDC004435 TaxID=3364701 RepID=UPI0036B58D5E